MKRCDWAGELEIYQKYHDEEWGVPVHDDNTLFEFLILEGAQAGLSWITILKKREGYRQAYDNFDPKKVAKYDEKKYDELLNNAGIVRNRAKIKSSIEGARLFLEIQKEYGSFDKYIWGFVNGKTIKNSPKNMAEINITTAESDAMSKDLKSKGFKFVGSTICYAFMQATGMVDDHVEYCYKRHI